MNPWYQHQPSPSIRNMITTDAPVVDGSVGGGEIGAKNNTTTHDGNVVDKNCGARLSINLIDNGSSHPNFVPTSPTTTASTSFKRRGGISSRSSPSPSPCHQSKSKVTLAYSMMKNTMVDSFSIHYDMDPKEENFLLTMLENRVQERKYCNQHHLRDRDLNYAKKQQHLRQSNASPHRQLIGSYAAKSQELESLITQRQARERKEQLQLQKEELQLRKEQERQRLDALLNGKPVPSFARTSSGMDRLLSLSEIVMRSQIGRQHQEKSKKEKPKRDNQRHPQRPLSASSPATSRPSMSSSQVIKQFIKHALKASSPPASTPTPTRTSEPKLATPTRSPRPSSALRSSVASSPASIPTPRPSSARRSLSMDSAASGGKATTTTTKTRPSSAAPRANATVPTAPFSVTTTASNSGKPASLSSAVATTKTKKSKKRPASALGTRKQTSSIASSTSNSTNNSSTASGSVVPPTLKLPLNTQSTTDESAITSATITSPSKSSNAGYDDGDSEYDTEEYKRIRKYIVRSRRKQQAIISTGRQQYENSNSSNNDNGTEGPTREIAAEEGMNDRLDACEYDLETSMALLMNPNLEDQAAPIFANSSDGFMTEYYSKLTQALNSLLTISEICCNHSLILNHGRIFEALEQLLVLTAAEILGHNNNNNSNSNNTSTTSQMSAKMAFLTNAAITACLCISNLAGYLESRSVLMMSTVKRAIIGGDTHQYSSSVLSSLIYLLSALYTTSLRWQHQRQKSRHPAKPKAGSNHASGQSTTPRSTPRSSSFPPPSLPTSTMVLMITCVLEALTNLCKTNWVVKETMIQERWLHLIIDMVISTTTPPSTMTPAGKQAASNDASKHRNDDRNIMVIRREALRCLLVLSESVSNCDPVHAEITNHIYKSQSCAHHVHPLSLAVAPQPKVTKAQQATPPTPRSPNVAVNNLVRTLYEFVRPPSQPKSVPLDKKKKATPPIPSTTDQNIIRADNVAKDDRDPDEFSDPKITAKEVQRLSLSIISFLCRYHPARAEIVSIGAFHALLWFLDTARTDSIRNANNDLSTIVDHLEAQCICAEGISNFMFGYYNNTCAYSTSDPSDSMNQVYSPIINHAIADLMRFYYGTFSVTFDSGEPTSDDASVGQLPALKERLVAAAVRALAHISENSKIHPIVFGSTKETSRIFIERAFNLAFNGSSTLSFDALLLLMNLSKSREGQKHIFNDHEASMTMIIKLLLMLPATTTPSCDPNDRDSEDSDNNALRAKVITRILANMSGAGRDVQHHIMSLAALTTATTSEPHINCNLNRDNTLATITTSTTTLMQCLGSLLDNSHNRFDKVVRWNALCVVAHCCNIVSTSPSNNRDIGDGTGAGGFTHRSAAARTMIEANIPLRLFGLLSFSNDPHRSIANRRSSNHMIVASSPTIPEKNGGDSDERDAHDDAKFQCVVLRALSLLTQNNEIQRHIRYQLSLPPPPSSPPQASIPTSPSYSPPPPIGSANNNNNSGAVLLLVRALVRFRGRPDLELYALRTIANLSQNGDFIDEILYTEGCLAAIVHCSYFTGQLQLEATKCIHNIIMFYASHHHHNHHSSQQQQQQHKPTTTTTITELIKSASSGSTTATPRTTAVRNLLIKEGVIPRLLVLSKEFDAVTMTTSNNATINGSGIDERVKKYVLTALRNI